MYQNLIPSLPMTRCLPLSSWIRVALVIIAATQPAWTQPPASRIYLFTIGTDEGQYTLGDPSLLTAYNPEGYNNHPYFMSDSVLLAVSQMPGQDQPDIYALDHKRGLRQRFTVTRAGEYSPALMPDYANLTAVRMEFQDGDTLLRLWKFPLRGNGEGQVVFPKLRNLGYYHWLTTTQAAVFLVDDPPLLAVATLFEDGVDTIAAGVGRCFRTGPKGRLYYLRKVHPQRWEIMAWDPKSGRSRFVATALPGSEDFALTSAGDLLMGSGNTLYALRPGDDRQWQAIADLSPLGIGRITRLALHPAGLLAVVVED